MLDVIGIVNVGEEVGMLGKLATRDAKEPEQG
jgi:hypothetical protein